MTMKLSEAILLGSTMSPQASGMYEDAEGRRCALGSALAAVGETVYSGMVPEHVKAENLVSKHWPHVDQPLWPGLCPDDCGGQCSDLGGLIVHLNDEHGWSREKIADYVAQFDPPEAEVEVNDSQDVQTDGGPGPVVLALEATES